MKGGNVEKFWICGVGGTSFFGHQKETLEEAEANAIEIARMPAFKGRRVFVLEAIKCCQLDELPIKWDK